MANTVFTQMGNVIGTEFKNFKDSVLVDLTTESTARTAGDTTLQTNIETEATTRLSNDNALQANIDGESASRTAGDNTLQTNIDASNANVASMITSVGGETIAHQHIVPANPTVALGSLEKPFADVFISQSSLYVNGTKVLSENAGTIDISADLDQNIRISTQGAGDIEFFPSTLGVIQLKGSVSIPSTKLLLTSDGLPMNFGQGIVVDGDISADNVTTLTNRVSSLETLTTSNDLNLDTIQEIVTFIQSNRADLDSISLDWSALQNVPAMYTEAEVGTILEFDNALATAMA